jgi:hypothetical protein
MTNKPKNWTAVLVICSFICMMQVSAMPAGAAVPADQAGLAAAGQGTDFHEVAAQKATPAKKKSILPWVLIGAGVVAVTAAVLFLVVLKKDYDIRGTWKFEYLEADGTVWWTGSAVFAGTKESGSVTADVGSVSTYTVADKTVTIAMSGGWALHTATFVDEDTLSGTWDWGGGTPGNFRALRLAGAAAVRQPALKGGAMPPHAG